MATKRTKRMSTMTEAIKQAVMDSGASFRAIERETGVKRQSLMKFMRDEQSLRLDKADRLTTYFGLELIERKDV